MALQITSPAGPSNVSISAKNTFTTSFISAPTAGTEYTISIPSGTKSFTLQADSNAKLIIASTLAGTSTDNSFDVYPNTFWGEELLIGTAVTIYVMSNKNNTKIKILTWN